MEKTIARTHEVSLLDQTFVLHIYKAIYWKEKSALLIADMHLGKTMHFRKSGIPIPREVSHQNWDRLVSLLEEFQPHAVIFLGDLFHSVHNSEWNLFSKTLKKYTHIRFQLVVGNHDILDRLIYEKAGIEIYEKHFCLPSLSFEIFNIHPIQIPGKYAGLVPSCSGTNFKNDIFGIFGIFWY